MMNIDALKECHTMDKIFSRLKTFYIYRRIILITAIKGDYRIL